MTERKNLCAHIPIALHEKVSAARAEAGLNTNDYVTQVLTEYYDWKENGGNIMARKTENTRTLAFQIPEELFQRIKEHLEKESKRRGIRLTQRDFVLGLIEQALEEAERESARTEETAAGQSDGAGSRPEPGAESPDGGAGNRRGRRRRGGGRQRGERGKRPCGRRRGRGQRERIPVPGRELNAP